MLSDKEYHQMGFKGGLEIHQQLNTKQKLFCRCPVGYINDSPSARILRHMRPTLSEMGEYDGTALMEFKTKKEVVYELFRDNTCTYEMDDTPPFPINQKALDIAIEIALLLKCNIVDEVHISRKQYLDGSIPTGFQRTAIIGLNGWIPYNNQKIRISAVTIEEDACREVSDTGHIVTFKTDRLSTPLVEVITEPDMRTPTEIAEVNWIIGHLLRSTGKVRRGGGTVRQDVNVSVKGGTRVEIKGVDRIGLIPRLAHSEALRQIGLLQFKKLIQEKFTKKNQLKYRSSDISYLLKPYSATLPGCAAAKGRIVMGIRISKFAGLMNYPLQTDWVFADELSGRIRVVACLDIMPNLLHSDEPENGGLNPVIWSRLKNQLKAGEEDSVIIVWGDKPDVETAINEIKLRVDEAFIGVPNETRQSIENCITDFERILPGPDRMYPDTDSAPTQLAPVRIQKIMENLVEPHWVKYERYLNKFKLPLQVAKDLSLSKWSELFDDTDIKEKADTLKLAIFLTQGLKKIRKRNKSFKISRDRVEMFLGLCFSELKWSNELAELFEIWFLKEKDLSDLLKEYTNWDWPSDEKMLEFIMTIINDKTFESDNKDLIVRRIIALAREGGILKFKTICSINRRLAIKACKILESI